MLLLFGIMSSKTHSSGDQAPLHGKKTVFSFLHVLYTDSFSSVFKPLPISPSLKDNLLSIPGTNSSYFPFSGLIIIKPSKGLL